MASKVKFFLFILTELGVTPAVWDSPQVSYELLSDLSVRAKSQEPRAMDESIS